MVMSQREQTMQVLPVSLVAKKSSEVRPGSGMELGMGCVERVNI